MDRRWQNITEIKSLKQKHNAENNSWMELQKFKAELYLKNREMENNWGLNEQEKEAIAKMLQEENELLMQSLKMHGLEIDIEQEQKRRFKTLLVEVQNLPHGRRVKRFYYNDGSINGLLLLEYEVNPGYKFDVTSLKGKMHPMSAEDIDKQIGDLRDEWERNY